MASQRRWFSPYPFEIYVWPMALVSVLALKFWGLRIDWNTAVYTFRPFVGLAPKLLLGGIVLQLVYFGVGALRKRSAAPVKEYLHAIVRPGWIVLWLRMYLAYMVLNYVYSWVKVAIPLVNPRLWDPQLWALDRVLHFGFSPSVFLVELTKGTALPSLLDAWYGSWIETVVWTIAFFACARQARLRRSFLLSCCLLWSIGAWMYMSLPSLGPCYANPEVFAEAMTEMPGARGGQEALWSNYQQMLQGRTGPLRRFNPTRGVAALPSLHVAAHVLFALWCRRFARPLYLLFVLGSLLTFLGSVVTGWHYAVDGYLGAALAFGCYWLACRFDPPEDEPETPPEDSALPQESSGPTPGPAESSS